ncbi:MAG: hypothetical protein CMN76_00430 [Spirochaetaceae bacterium]|nr:hypothetical protein [Spirochaetaceae bacterium]|tara:strand:- start:46698 stop:47279 length:582 start_codon:yes stop_codon:yes gene_type:complete
MTETLPTGKKAWKEIKEGKEKFQEIIKMLVDFDERTGRHGYAPLKECHYMRKAIAVGEPSHIRILACSYPAFLYYVAAELSNDQGHVTTCWVHEDGVKAERKDRQDEPDHPVHGVLCMSDLFEQNAEIGAEDRQALGPLMQEYMGRADSSAEELVEERKEKQRKESALRKKQREQKEKRENQARARQNSGEDL